MFVDVLDRFPDAREKLVVAWCLALIGEGLIVAAQVATGAAYDPVRGITRAQGTIGADSLGAFAMFGVFGALYMRSVASTRLGRSLGTVALVASLAMMFLSISRGPVIAFAIALGLLLLPTGGRWTRKQLATALLLFSLAGLGALPHEGVVVGASQRPDDGRIRPTGNVGCRAAHRERPPVLRRRGRAHRDVGAVVPAVRVHPVRL